LAGYCQWDMSSRPKLSRIYWPAVFFQICPGDENSSWCLKEKSGRPFSSSFSWYFLIPFYSEGKGAGHVCCADTHITHKLAGSLPSLKFCGGLLYSEGFSSPQLPDVARPSVRPSVRDVCPRFALRCWPTRFDCPPSPGHTFPGGIWSVKRRAAMILTA
jgi:hypothetical protein